MWCFRTSQLNMLFHKFRVMKDTVFCCVLAAETKETGRRGDGGGVVKSSRQNKMRHISASGMLPY